MTSSRAAECNPDAHILQGYLLLRLVVRGFVGIRRLPHRLLIGARPQPRAKHLADEQNHDDIVDVVPRVELSGLISLAIEQSSW